jgi:hypothetical protein
VQLSVNQAVLKVEERGKIVHRGTVQSVNAKRRDKMRHPFKIDTGGNRQIRDDLRSKQVVRDK